MDSKLCNSCQIDKPIEEYQFRKNRGNYIPYAKCIPCMREYRRKKYWSNRNIELQRNRHYQLFHRKPLTLKEKLYGRNHKRAKRLIYRLYNADLLIELCMKEWGIKDRSLLNGRVLVEHNSQECVTIAIWLIRNRNKLHPDALADMFNCSTKDVLTRLKSAVYENSYYHGDILVRDKVARVLKAYNRRKLTNSKKLPFKKYEEFTEVQRKSLLRLKNIKIIKPEGIADHITVEDLINISCWYYGVSLNDFRTEAKGRSSVGTPRHVVAYLLNKYRNKEAPEIAQLLGVDVSVVYYALRAGKTIVSHDQGNLLYEIQRRIPVIPLDSGT